MATYARPDIGAFMAELRRREGIAPRALEFAILMAARSGEARCASWAKIDLGRRLWTVPAMRMKAGRERCWMAWRPARSCCLRDSGRASVYRR